MGAVRRGEPHPIHRFLEAGVPVAICCDNTTVSRTDQVKETLRLARQLGLETVNEIHRAAETHSFIRPETALSDREHDL